MKDISGKEIQIGDNIVYVAQARRTPKIETTTVQSIHPLKPKNNSYEYATINGKPYFRNDRVMILPKDNSTALMKRIGYLQNDYDSCINNDKEMPDELKKDIAEFQTDFNLSETDLLQILRNELSLAEIALLLE